MPIVDICGRPSSDCSTIDGTSDPALNNARAAFPSAQSHADTLAAKDNLLRCLPASPQRLAMIVGHGQAATIVTGSGTLTNDQDKRISVDNIVIWTPILTDLAGHIRELTLCACDAGAVVGPDDLLKEVANVVRAKVYGFTSLIFIGPTGNITCGPKGKWRHALPDKVSPPLSVPPIRFEKVMHLKLKYGDQYRTVEITDVFAVHFSDPAQGGKRVSSQEGEAAQSLVGTIDFTEPSEIDGSPLAVTTGILEIEYLIEGQPDERSFVVFNDRLLFDQTTPDTFYFASPDLAEALNQFRPNLSRRAK